MVAERSRASIKLYFMVEGSSPRGSILFRVEKFKKIGKSVQEFKLISKIFAN